MNPVIRGRSAICRMMASIETVMPGIFNAALPKMLDDDARKAARAVFGIAEDADPIEWFKVQNSATKTTNAAGKSKTSAEILIYDIIDPWGVSAGDFANALNALDVDEIVVGINSPGGLVFDGIAIMNALKRHPANIITRIDGVAASAASFIAMAGNEIQTSKYAEMMIHEARGYVSGTAADMKEMLDLLVRHNETIAAVYQDRAGGELKDWLKQMKNETWFTAEEMIAAGLADTIIEPADESSAADETQSLKNRFDLSVFNYAGRKAAPPPQIRTGPTRTTKNDQRKAATMGLKEQLAEKYGVDANLDDDAFAAALDAAVAAESEDTDAPPADDPAAADPAADGALAAAAATLKGLGFAVIETSALDALKQQGQQGSAAFETIAAENDLKTVNEAIRGGKIKPADREKWTKNLKLDRDSGGKLGYAEALKTAEAVFPVQEIGTAMNPDPGASMVAPDDLSWFDTAATEPSTGSAGE
ncbi:Clp protease ClpP [Mycobacterium hackensackense]|uniref:head maturation protease, ClpP-related n=1 Tax=Mycobacterium hackensackense TaxID=228909 RepID=UPI00226587A2|nr:head maturation protease, ClpP-related [Mycobacterium hackensackense]MCV7255676.1 Clp protease ClpP [Mycobacterium hackensackense]